VLHNFPHIARTFEAHYQGAAAAPAPTGAALTGGMHLYADVI
jgi:hypothetical protein